MTTCWEGLKSRNKQKRMRESCLDWTRLENMGCKGGARPGRVVVCGDGGDGGNGGKGRTMSGEFDR